MLDVELTNPAFGLRLNYYPPLSEGDIASGAGRMLGHEDMDLFTLLPIGDVVEDFRAFDRLHCVSPSPEGSAFGASKPSSR